MAEIAEHQPNAQAAVISDPATEVTLEEKEQQISTTIEHLPEAAAILTYED